MQDPKRDIQKVVHTLCTTCEAKELENACQPRNEILGLFQWYRLVSPRTSVEVDSIMYDADLNVLFFEVRETVNLWFNPLASRPGRRFVRPKLRKANGYNKIEFEEDFIHPMDQIGILAPMSLRFGSLLSNLGACVFRSVRLNSGLEGGTVSFAGLLEAAGLARSAGGKADGSANKG